MPSEQNVNEDFRLNVALWCGVSYYYIERVVHVKNGAHCCGVGSYSVLSCRKLFGLSDIFERSRL